MKIYRLELRVDQELIDFIDKWRENHFHLDMSRSEAIRTLIMQNADDFHFTKQQRYMFLMQLMQLKNSCVDNSFLSKEQIENLIEATISGHDWAIKEIMPAVTISEPDKIADVQFVYDVLAMFSRLKYSLSLLKDSSDSFNNLKFKGFDDNKETNLCSICSYIQKKLKKYQDLLPLDNEFAYMEMRPRYTKMLERFNEYSKFGALDEEQLVQLNNIS